MGQNISLNTCVSGGSIVRVMKTDGEFESFDFPCVAAEVMVQHRGFLVVHCSPVSGSGLGQRSKITIMLPDQPLIPGQPYMLYPIPDQYKKSLARSKSFSMMKKKFEQPGKPTVTIAEKRVGRRKALKMFFTRLNLATFVAHNLNEKEGGGPTPLKVPNGPVSQRPPAREQKVEDDEGDEEKPLTVTLPNPDDLNYGWKPVLTTIPESPLGFHSLPQSPLGLYKMDGIPRSPLAVAGTRRLPPSIKVP